MYRRMIQTTLSLLNQQADPAHVEAWMRVENPTLDAMTPTRWVREVRAAVECIESEDIAVSDDLARSYGLEPGKAA